MLDASSYNCLGALLRDAFIQFKSDTAFVEMSRKRESSRYSYAEASA